MVVGAGIAEAAGMVGKYDGSEEDEEVEAMEGRDGAKEKELRVENDCCEVLKDQLGLVDGGTADAVV